MAKAKVIKPGKGTTAGFANFPTLSFSGPMTAAKVVRPKAPPTPYDDIYKLAFAGVQSPAQITSMANSQALAQERARLAAMKAISDETIAQYNNQATRAGGFAEALAKIQSSEDEQAQARYGAAADRLTGIGTGLTGAVADAYQGSVDQAKQTVARLTGGVGQVTAPEAGDIRNAAQYAGVTGPAASLVADAANAARLTQSDAATRAQNLALIQRGYTSKADDAIAQYGRDARAEIAKRPASIAELVNQLTSNRQTGISNLASILNARTTYRQAEQKRLDDLAQTKVANKLALDKFKSDNEHWAAEDARATRQIDLTERALDNTLRTSGAAITGFDPLTGMPTLSSTQANRQWQGQLATIASNISGQNGYRMVWRDGKLVPQTDAKGNVVPLAGYKLNKDGTGVSRVYAPSGSTSPGTKAVAGYPGYTASEVRTLKGDVEETVREGLKVDPDVKTFVGVGKKGPNGEVADEDGYIHGASTPTDYPTALRAAIEAGPDTAKWRATAKRIVDNHYKVGENRRPYPPKQGLRIATNNAKVAYSKAIPIEDAVATAIEMAAGTISDAMIRKAFHKVYYSGPFSPIPGSPHFQPQEGS